MTNTLGAPEQRRDPVPPTESEPREDADSRSRRISLESLTNRIVSGSATIIAIIALATGIYQSKLMRDQAKAAVWPYLIVGNSGNDGYARILQNVGLGPAIVRSFEVRVNGTAVHSWKEAADSMRVHLGWKGSKSTTILPGLVLPTNAVIDILTLPDSADEQLFRSRLGTLQTSICYCSLYGDCWNVGARGFEPRQVRACSSNGPTEFER